MVKFSRKSLQRCLVRLSTLALPLIAVPAMAKDVSFVGATFYSSDTGKLARNRTVVVRDGTIVFITRSTDADLRRTDREVIDAREKFLIPGLIDAHVHITSPNEGTLYVANGVTTVRNMWGFPFHLALREEVNKGRLLGPRILTAGRLYDGTPAIWPGSFTDATQAGIAKAVQEDKASGFDYVKVYSRLTPEQFRTITAAARDANVPVIGHVPNAVPLPDAIHSGMRSIEHLWGWAGSLQRDVAFKAFDPLDRSQWSDIDPGKLDRVAGNVASSKVWIVPTLFVVERLYRLHSWRTMMNDEGVEYLPRSTVAQWAKLGESRESMSAIDKENGEKGLRISKELVLKLYQHKARLLLGSDSNNAFVVHGYSFFREAQLFVDAGLKPLQVLKIATADAADFLGVPAGRIKVGASADLVLLNADPAISTANWKRRDGVMLRGRWLPKSELEAALAQVKAENSAATAPALGGLGYSLPDEAASHSH